MARCSGGWRGNSPERIASASQSKARNAVGRDVELVSWPYGRKGPTQKRAVAVAAGLIWARIPAKDVREVLGYNCWNGYVSP